MANEPQGTATPTVDYTPAAGELLIEFCRPLWGFADHKHFGLRPAARDGVWWLQSTDTGGPTFVLADPFVVDQAYVVDLGEKERATLAIAAPDEALTLVMLALPVGKGGVVTGNFRAPLVINIRTHTALQVVSRDDSHEMQRAVNLAKYPLCDDGTAPTD
jgi:flagellar assembly factor FliW